jgi:hypothetical protein
LLEVKRLGAPARETYPRNFNWFRSPLEVADPWGDQAYGADGQVDRIVTIQQAAAPYHDDHFPEVVGSKPYTCARSRKTVYI